MNRFFLILIKGIIMKKLITAFILLATTASAVSASVYVRGHFRSNGTYVQPHYRSSPDGIRFNNWSCCGNINPYTGKRGYGW